MRSNQRTRFSIAAVAAIFAIGVACLAIIAAARADAGDANGRIVREALPAVVMVLSIEQRGRELVPISSGSGTIIGSDGTILTNFHVIGDKDSKEPHELFVVARYRASDGEPELVCAGRPAFGKLKPALDLAIIKCDLDLSLRSYRPAFWPTVPIGRSEEMIPGEQIVVLGYPNLASNRVQASLGLLTGWMREAKDSSHRAYMKTDAAISHGNSGGAAIGEDGKLIGVPTAYTVTTAEQGEIILTAGKVGLIRPIEHARDLIAVADSGWVPGPDNDVPETDKAAPTGSAGVRITSTVVNAANQHPVEGAFAIVVRPEVKLSEVSLENLEAQALTWGRTNAGGVFFTDEPIQREGRYAIIVIAKGYETLIADGSLEVPADAPSQLDPWEIIRIERR